MGRAVTRKIETVTAVLYSKANKANPITISGEPGKELDDKIAATRNVLETLFTDIVVETTVKGIKYVMSEENFIAKCDTQEPYEIKNAEGK